VRLAVRHFKREQGLPATGLAGVEALRRLGIHKPACGISAPLARGASGPPVACLRQFLAGRGIRIALDGPYFAAVTKGVGRLEARLGLPVDGVADEAFLRAIEAWR
jgi:hypothetical protein